MGEAKAPDDARNWNALDIYVFCNGQQYTPPRKFHLQSDKLKFWETTLRFLARSQYGSRHSTINLYSIEGKKVEGPLELTNDAAYVAVAPHDCFVQSGYDKYLLKASRSREKRQEKRVNNNNAIQDDHALGIVTIKMNNNTQKETLKLSMDNDKSKRKPNVTMKHVVPTRPTPNKTPLTRSPIEKRKINSKNTILRKINNCGRVNPPQSLKSKDTVTKSLHPIAKESLDYICRKTLETASSILQEKDPQGTENTINEHVSSNIAMNVIVEKDDGDTVTQKTVYQNLESDAVSYFVDADSIRTNAVDNLEKNSNISNIIGIVPNQSSKLGMENATKDMTNTEEITKQSNITTDKKEPYSEINKECVINLNLNIELKNCDANPINTGTKFRRCYCFNNEKQSQTNLQINLHEEMITKDDDYINEIGKMKSLFERDPLEGECRVVILRCSCSNKNNNNCTLNVETPKEDIQFPTRNTQHFSEKHQNEEFWIAKDNNMGVNMKEDIVKEHKVSISSGSPTICQSKPKIDTETISSISTSSQTDWCNTLVEARCNADGSYTFHLPSLEKLKQLKL